MADYEGAVTGLIPCSVVLLTAADGDRRDAMTATTVFVAEEPPVLTMSVAKHILMHDLIETSREFVVNLASSEQASLAKKLGPLMDVTLTNSRNSPWSPGRPQSYAPLYSKARSRAWNARSLTRFQWTATAYITPAS